MSGAAPALRAAPRSLEARGSTPWVSFEFFPPKTEAMNRKLWEAIKRLEPLAPRFVSVTYGAGGGTRERTHATVIRLLRETTLTPAAHLTCVGAKREEIDEIARRYWSGGVRHIVALRGDPPGNSSAIPHMATDLVQPRRTRRHKRRTIRNVQKQTSQAG